MLCLHMKKIQRKVEIATSVASLDPKSLAFSVLVHTVVKRINLKQRKVGIAPTIVDILRKFGQI